MTREEYWMELIQDAGLECGLSMTEEQIKWMADAVQISNENIGSVFYQPENPSFNEIKQLKKELQDEKDKVVCKKCVGTGRIISQGPYHSSNSPCCECQGEGYRKP